MKLFTGNGIKNNKIKNPKLQSFRYFLTIAVIAVPLVTTGCNSTSSGSVSINSGSGGSSSGGSSSGAGVTAPSLSYASSSGKTIGSGSNFSVSPSTFTTGGGAVTCAVTSGHSLPAGFSVNNSSVISATSPAVGTYSLYITATNSADHADSGLVTLTVQLQAPNITFGGQTASFDYNDNGTQTATASDNGVLPFNAYPWIATYGAQLYGFHVSISTTNSGGTIASCAVSSADTSIVTYVTHSYWGQHTPDVQVSSGECLVDAYVAAPVGAVDGVPMICVTATNTSGTSTPACFSYTLSSG